jgi:ribosomal protein S18 acetylase RimI-like enzyme
MRPDEFEAFAEHGRAGYVQQMVEFSGMEPSAALAKAERDYALTLPNGLATPGHWLFVVEHDRRRVGVLWFAERVLDGRTVAYLYEIEIDEAERGHGYGRAAMEAYEREAARRGLFELELNVFGGNDVARALYRSLGWRETAVHMVKRVELQAGGQPEA